MSGLELTLVILTLVFSAGMGSGFLLLVRGTQKYRNRVEELFLLCFIAGMTTSSLFGYVAFEGLGSNRAVEALWTLGRGGILFSFPMGIGLIPGLIVVLSKTWSFIRTPNSY